MNTDTLWDLTRGERRRYAGAVVAMVIFGGFYFSGPLIAKGVIDLVVAARPAGGDGGPAGFGLLHALTGGSAAAPRTGPYLLLSGTAIVLLSGIGGVFLYLRGRWAAVASERIVHRLRARLFEHLEHLPANYHDGADTGDLVQRCSSDVETVRVFLATDVVDIGRAVLLVLAVLPFMLVLSPALTAVSLALLPLIVLFAWLFFHQVKRVFLVTDEAEAAMTAMLQENLTGVRVVRAFAREDFERHRFAALNARFRDHNETLIRWMALYWSASDLLCLGQIGLVLLVGAAWVMDGGLGYGDLFAFFTYVSMIIFPIRQMGRVLTDSGKAVVALGRIREILDTPLEESDENGGTPTQTPQGAITIEDLWFRYPGATTADGAHDAWILRGLSLEVRPGETIGLVGPPGSGKSSLIALLLRLYDYQRGSVRLDDHDLRTLPRAWLRRQFATVFQDPFLYSRSLRDNLLLGQPEADDEALERAIRAAALADTIAGFRDGLDTLVGERGATLSGGQRQRTALARALLREAPFLVLDDSLSAVDAGTEAEIIDFLQREKGRRTTIIVTHRLSAVQHADRIAVLADGRVTQLGDHATLAARHGPYRRLCELQHLPVPALDDRRGTTSEVPA